MLKLFRVMVRRDLLLAYRQKSDVLQTVFFFLVVITLVPLGVGAETELLRSMAPGIVWVAALLAALVSSRTTLLTARLSRWSSLLTRSP